MDRRTLLAALGAVGATGVAGCLGGGDGRADTTTAAPGTPSDATDGYPPESVVGTTPAAPETGPGTFDTLVYEGTSVPLVPIDVAYDWYRRREARFADARSGAAYRRAHITGAVSSPAPTGQDDGDPVALWPTDERVVTYCGCPHHLSTMRAAALVESGYEDVYAIDEGFGPWFERGYPVSGAAVTDRPAERAIEGRTDPADAGGDAWVRHRASGQREATRIGEDGHYVLRFRFADLSEASTLVVETPSYTVTGTVAELTGGVVTGER